VTGPREPGWYDDPGGNVDQLRWWEGTGWTGITRVRMPHERVAAPPPPPVDWSAGELLDTADHRPPHWRWLVVLGIVGVIAVLVATGALPGLDGSGTTQPTPTGQAAPRFPVPTDTVPVPTDTVPLPVPTPRPTGPVAGRITDEAAGLSYPVLAGSWQAWDLFSFQGILGSNGYYRVLQRDAPNGEYWANVTSGLVSPAVASRDDLAASAQRLVTGLDDEYYPQNSQQGRQEKPITVDGHRGYLIRYVAVFDPATSKGYQAKSEQVTVLLVDTGRQLPAVLYVSLPDTVRPLWTAVDRLIASVRVLP
jgi:hypothetical protein